MERLDIVNDADEEIGSAPKDEVYSKRLKHRIVHVLIFNSKGEMALQLRAKTVKFCPGYWCTAAGGHVRSGESYEQAAARELYEELGIKARLKFFAKDIYYSPERDLYKFLATYTAIADDGFRLNHEEVEGLSFFPLNEIIRMAKGEKIHPELRFLIRKHYE